MLHGFKRVIRLWAIALLALVPMAIAAESAQAFNTIDYIYFKVEPYGGEFGPRHTIAYNDASSLSGSGVCVNAMNDTGTTWVGATQCAGGWIEVAYCQCALRYPWAGPTTGGITMSAQEQYNF